MSVTQADLENLQQEMTAYADNLTMYSFIMVTAFAILFMQAGFAFLEAGGCRSKNTKSILYKNGIDLVIGVLIWWFWGYGFATAQNDNNSQLNFDADLALSFLISVVFCTTSATIVSGAVAERIDFWVYTVSTISIAGASYPLIVQWIWTSHNPTWEGSGWLKDEGVVDFAGSGVVHLLGAVAAFTASWWIGPRIGRFVKNADGSVTVKTIDPYDPVLCTIGTWILVFAWMSFNASSSGGFGLSSLQTSARAVVMTIIALAAGGLSCTVLQLPNDKLSLAALNNGFLGALVAITAGCASVDGVGAFFIGLIGGIISLYGYKIPIFFGVDDPLDTFTVHGLNGAWGMISVGLFGKKVFMNPDFDYGCFYGGDGTLLGYQIATVLVITAVSAAVTSAAMGFLYVVFKYGLGRQGNPLRIPEEIELMGLDVKEFDGYAFPEDTLSAEKYLKLLESHSSKKSSKHEDSRMTGGDVSMVTVNNV